ncbi:DNA replication terminus site-binding protein (plasmid) [Pseudoalteromonas espejiana]
MHKHATKTLTKKWHLKCSINQRGYRNPRMMNQQKWQSLVAQEQLRVASLGEKS